MEPVSALSRVDVDLGVIQHNYRFFQKKVGPAKVAAVVKANAYGLGLESVSKALWQAGCDTFFVAFLEEGITLCRSLVQVASLGYSPKGDTQDQSFSPHPQPHPKIYVLEGFQKGQEKAYLEHSLRPVLGSEKSIQAWREVAPSSPCAIHVDTGMARTGFERGDLERCKPEIDVLNVSLLMTHYASSDEPESPQNQQQKNLFKEICALFPKAETCLANSRGVFLGPDYWGQTVRVGLGLSGLIPFSDDRSEAEPGQKSLRSAVRVSAKIIQLRTLQAGQSVGYNATWVASKTTRLATIGMGYADGLPRALSNQGCFFWGAQALPIRGTISMDFTMVDVTEVSCHTLKVGDELVFFEDSDTLERQAKAAGTIGYELLAQLGPRCRRVYIPAESKNL